MTTQYLTSPVGRIVAGDIYDLVEQKGDNGQPKLIKTGTNAGQPLKQRWFHIAVPKTPGIVDFKQDPQLQAMVQAAQVSWPRGEFQQPRFAWKIEDGDQPNQNGKFNEYARGHWLIKFATSTAVGVYHWVGQTLTGLTEDGAVKAGYWVQVQFEYTSNAATGNQTPGMYCTPINVCLNRTDEVIQVARSVDPASAGFAQGQTLQTSQPQPAFAPQQAAPAAAAAPAAPAAPMAPVAGFSNGPAAPAAPVRRLVQGVAYTEDALRASNWTPAQIAALPIAP